VQLRRGSKAHATLNVTRLQNQSNWVAVGLLLAVRRPRHMNLGLANERLPLWARITAAFSALLVMGMLVFAASPGAHAWLHSHDHLSTAANVDSHAGHAKPDQQDDGCAIVVFAAGVLVALILFFLGGAFRRAASAIFPDIAVLYRATPRYWLPPLCGPP
jgi:TRAP-type C4-dicarboxylate transport system permease small subunit